MDLRRVLFFCCLVGGPLASATAGRAEVLYKAAIRPGSQGSFDLNDDGDLDFSIGPRWVASGPDHLHIYFGIQQPQRVGPTNAALTDGEVVPVVESGLSIGPTSEPWSWTELVVDRKIAGVSLVDGLLGFPPSPATQFIGVRFHADDGLHYGWIRLARNYWEPYDTNHPDWPPGTDPNGRYGNAISLPRIDQFSPGVIDWAFETTPNTPIAAGAVPEPATTILAGCGIAITLIRLLRERSSNRDRAPGRFE